MPRLLITLFAAVILHYSFLIPSCLAGNSWQPIGPFGGIVNALAIDPTNSQTVYAGTGGDGGVFKTTNGGASWIDAKIGISSMSVNAIAIDPNDSQTVYVGTSNNGGGVFKTSNGGASWTAVNTGITDINISVYALAVDPTNSQTVYAGTDGGGVFKSKDGGTSWSAAISGMTNKNLRSLVIDPTHSQTVYAGTGGGGVFKSTDGGASWSAANSGMTSANLRSLAIDPTDSRTVYAVGTGVFKSIDGGASWTASYSGITMVDVASIAIDPTHTQTVYAGTNGGGVYKSTDGCASWTAANSGIQNTYVFSLTIDPSNSQTVYAGINGYYGGINGSSGLFKSTNGSASWTATNNGMNSTTVASLALDPSNGQTLYVGTFGNGIFKSVNGGASWKTANAGMTSTNVLSLAIDPSHSQTIYAAASQRGVFKSTDGGTTWSAVNNGLTYTIPGYATVYTQAVTVLAIDSTSTQTVYAGTNGAGLFKSTDGGASWISCKTGMTNMYVVSIAVDPTNSQTVYAGSNNGGIFKSTNAGALWTVAYSGPAYTSISSLVIDSINSQTIYAGIFGGGVFKSTDAGASWASTNIPNTLIHSLAIDPANDQTIYAGASQSGLFKSTNGGISWTTAALMNADVNSVVIDPANIRTVYIGSRGVFKALQSNSIPIVNGATSASFSEGSSGNFGIAASGWPLPLLTVAGMLPAGITFDPATGNLSGVPASGSAGTYPLLVTAANGIPPDSVRGITLTVLPLTDLSATITGPVKGSGLASLAIITGSASGTGLSKIEVQVTDGNYYLQSDRTFALTPAWLAASGSTSWSFNTSTVAWREGISYTIQVRACSGSTTSAPAASTFTIAVPTGKVGTILSMTANPVRGGGTTTFMGTLARMDTLGLAPGQTVQLIVTPPSTDANPNPAPIIASSSTDGSGNFSGTLSVPSVGVYLVQARFEGTGTLAASFASQTLSVTPQSGYAVIVVGEASDQSLLAEHTATADGIYATLVNKRGFLPADISYLKSTGSAAVTKQQIKDAIGQMKARYAAVPAPFYLFMIDHGSQNGFVLGDTTSALTLAPTEIVPWLDDFESGINGDTLASFPRFLIIGSCYSGAFVPQLSKPGRIIITSSGADEQSLAGFSIYNSATGTTFSGGEYFIDNMINFLGRGDSFKDAVTQSSSNVALRDPRKVDLGLHSGAFDTLAQHPLLDDNGDGSASYLPAGGTDGAVAANLFLGVGIRSLGNPADITAVTGTAIIPATQTSDAPLWLQVGDNSRIAKAWMEIRTPVSGVSPNGGTGQVIPHLITQPLYYDGFQWNGSYGFPNAGTYTILYYTQDNQTGDISPTAHSTVYRQLAGISAPSSFSLSSPANGGSVSPMFTLAWQDVTSNNSVTYTLQVATDQNFRNIVYQEEGIPQNATYIADGKLKNSATNAYYCQNGASYCYWKVQAIDRYGAVTESSYRSFTVVTSNGLPALLKGYVRDSITGAPIAGAKIRTGSFSLDSLANGFYLNTTPTGILSLTVSANGYAPKTLDGIIATAGGVTGNDFTLQPVQANSITVGIPAPATASYLSQFTVAASASSGLPVSYSSGSISVCTNSGATFTMVAPSGACLVQYDQAGDGNFTQATRVTNSTTAAKAVLTVAADNQSRAFNSANPALTASFTGFVGGDTRAVLSGAPAISTGATQASPAGNYPITITTGTLAAANYSFSLANGTLSVTIALKPGDCNGDGIVTIAEVQSAINMFLGLKPVQACVDQDQSGVVTISEVQKVINAFLGL